MLVGFGGFVREDIVEVDEIVLFEGGFDLPQLAVNSVSISVRLTLFTRSWLRSTRISWAVFRTDSCAACQVLKQPLSFSIALTFMLRPSKSAASARRRSASLSSSSTLVSASVASLARVGGFDEQGVPVNGGTAEGAEGPGVRLEAIDEHVNHQPVFPLQMRQHLAHGLEAERLGFEWLVIDGHRHNRSFATSPRLGTPRNRLQASLKATIDLSPANLHHVR